MRVLLVAEGKHEFHGALEILVRRLLPAGTTLSHVEKIKMSDPQIGHVSGKGPRLFRRILSAMRKAMDLNCDALVLVIDEDGDRERRKHIQHAQESTVFSIQRAIGLAIHSFDAWMLADETAISHALQQTIPCQPAPEELHNPKDTFDSLSGSVGRPLPTHEAYALIAQHSNISVLINRCHNGFAPFSSYVMQLHD